MPGSPDSHLDLGCGLRPRNPYHRQKLFGIDVRPDAAGAGPDYTIVQRNVAVETIPFANNFFASVSAFDLLEHIPRQLYRESSGQIFYPFVNLMSEIWRVLAPGGIFLAVTPAFPTPSAFVDPTHVNIITRHTHTYFCGKNPAARGYGFTGEFRAGMVKFTAAANVQSLPRPPIYRQWFRDWHRRLLKGGVHHLVWELEAVKNSD